MVSTSATSVSVATVSGATSMLSMVGGALKKINGVKDPNKLSSHCHMKEKVSVLQYQPTPIHLLKAKSLGCGFEYDPFSNYSASLSRVTLPSSTKRSHSSDAVIPAKRLKMVVDDDDNGDEIEGKFSDSDDDRIVNRTSIPTSGTAHITDSGMSTKSSETHSLPSLSVNKLTANLQINNSLSEPLPTNLPVSASATKLAATQSKPKDSNCFSLSESQTNVAVSSNHSDSVQLPSAKLKEDHNLAKWLSSNSKAAAFRDSKHTKEDHSSSFSCKYKFHHKYASNRNIDDNKSSKTKDQHTRADSHHSCDTTGRKQNSSDHHIGDRSSSQTKPGHVHSDKDSFRKSETALETHKHTSDKHNRYKQSDKKATASSSYRSGQKEEKKEKEKHVSETSAQKHKTVTTSSSDSNGQKEKKKEIEKHLSETEKHMSKTSAQKQKTTSSESPSFKGTLAHDKKHKMSDKESKHRHAADGASGHHPRLEGRSTTESRQSKAATDSGSALSGKDSKYSHHKCSKHRENNNVAGSQHKQPVASSQKDSQLSKTVTCNSSTAADKKFVNAVRNVELFGTDSDTESDLLKSSSVLPRVPAKQRETACSKFSVFHPSSQSSDEVILLSSDDLSDASDNDDTFEQCQQLYNDLARQQQSKQATCTSSSVQNVS